MTETLIKWPSRARPLLFAKHFPQWDVPGVHFVISLDSDDSSLPIYQDFLWGRANVRMCVGKSAGKVHAINRDVPDSGWDMMVLASDDFVPQHEDYAEVLRSALFKAFPDGDGVVQFPDGRRTDWLNTCPVMGRKYFDRFGYVYHPDYVSTHCDDEMTEVSRRLSRVVQLNEVVIKHEWIGDHAPDALHARNESYFQRDAKLYAARQRAGFPN